MADGIFKLGTGSHGEKKRDYKWDERMNQEIHWVGLYSAGSKPKQIEKNWRDLHPQIDWGCLKRRRRPECNTSLREKNYTLESCKLRFIKNACIKLVQL